MRLVSVLDPGSAEAISTPALARLPQAEVTLFAPARAVPSPGAAPIHRISLATDGSGRSARYPSLATAIAVLDPEIVHVRADPDRAVAQQAAALCARSGRGLVLEVDRAAPSGLAAWRARYTLRRTSAVLARSHDALASIRRLGFRGTGVIATPGADDAPLPPRADARRALHLPHPDTPVFGWVGPVGPRSGVRDALEAVAACQHDIVLAIPAVGPAGDDLLDRADALEILHRVRFFPAAGREGFAALLAVSDAILIAPPNAMALAADQWRAIASAQSNRVPIAYADVPGLAEAIGAGGWPVPPQDPALLARLLDELAAEPARLAAVAAIAEAHAAQHHSPDRAAMLLHAALCAASRHPQPSWPERPLETYLPHPPDREPSHP